MRKSDMLPEPFLAPAALARRRLTLALALAGIGSGCGGGGGGSSPAPAPGPPPAPGVPGPAWSGFAHDAQHSAQSVVATQSLIRIAWQTPVDLAPQFLPGNVLLAHYGSPVITANNTVIVPVKTGATGGFRVEARSGSNGGLIWSADIDYILPPHQWTPSFNPALSSAGRLFVPAAGGKLLLRDNADAATGSLQTAVFYGAAVYAAAPAQLDASVFINTPVTIDSQGNAFFGFIANAGNPAGLRSGIARLAADGSGRWAAASDLATDAAISKMATNCAPALSPDGSTLYVAVNIASVSGTVQRGSLLALDSTSLALKSRVALVDPQARVPARVSDDSTASPTVGPDGDVYYGVLEANFGTHNGRGWLLHFDATLGTTKTPGSFGWDDTASIVPVAMVPSYRGSSSYLLATKYNNYGGVGTGDGLNRMAVLDPNDAQAEAISSVAVMREVLTILGPTPESVGATAVKEWCVNTVAVDPLGSAVLVNSEDGYLYRWDLRSNSFTQRIQLTGGIGEAYTPTAIGADGAVYAVNTAVLFSITR